MEEKKVTKNEEIENDSVLRKIILLAKRNILLVILIVAAFMLGGYVFAKLQKPTYTSANDVTITARGLMSDSITNNIDYMSLDAVSVLDFCETGVVADRADFYYNSFLQELEGKPGLSSEEYARAFSIFERYNALKNEEKPASYDEYMEKVITSKDSFKTQTLGYSDYVNNLLVENKFAEFGEFKYFAYNKKRNPSLTLDEYMAQFSTIKAYDVKNYVYTGEIKASSISSTGYNERNKYNNHFALHYFELNSQKALDKVIMVVLAASNELVSDSQYFKGVAFNLEPSGSAYVSTNSITKKTVFTAFLIGLVVAIVVVYLKTILDKTIKDKKTLEELTGVKLISYISKRED